MIKAFGRCCVPSFCAFMQIRNPRIKHRCNFCILMLEALTYMYPVATSYRITAYCRSKNLYFSTLFMTSKSCFFIDIRNIFYKVQPYIWYIFCSCYCPLGNLIIVVASTAIIWMLSTSSLQLYLVNISSKSDKWMKEWGRSK